MPFPLRSMLCSPASDDNLETLRQIGHTLPYDLRLFWQQAAGARLFEDTTYGQWGFLLWGPCEAQARTANLFTERRDSLIRGDVVVGEFRGDSDLLLVRCDGEAEDFGQVLIILPMDHRPVWPVVAPSFSKFLHQFVVSSGEKFWEATT